MRLKKDQKDQIETFIEEHRQAIEDRLFTDAQWAAAATKALGFEVTVGCWDWWRSELVGRWYPRASEAVRHEEGTYAIAFDPPYDTNPHPTIAIESICPRCEDGEACVSVEGEMMCEDCACGETIKVTSEATGDHETLYTVCGYDIPHSRVGEIIAALDRVGASTMTDEKGESDYEPERILHAKIDTLNEKVEALRRDIEALGKRLWWAPKPPEFTQDDMEVR